MVLPELIISPLLVALGMAAGQVFAEDEKDEVGGRFTSVWPCS
jgi:hypothetical protein